MSSSLVHTVGLVLALALLEAVLSADNAVAIAALVSDLACPSLRQQALNRGLLAAFALRFAAILLATWVVRYPQLQMLGGLYLVWLAARHFQQQLQPDEPDALVTGAKGQTLATVIALVALTDLAFSLDSVTAAVAVTDEVWLIVLGGAMGIALLRFLAARVLVWMETWVNLQNAAYLTVLAVGLRLIARVAAPQLAPSEPLLLATMGVFFLWGFSGRWGGLNCQPSPPTPSATSSRAGNGV